MRGRITFFVALLTISLPAFAEQSRPNILWLSTEDISAHLGCYGDPDAITPTLDALASRGIRYTRAFTTAPVCAPNRAAIITGMYQMSIGAHHMRSGGEGTERSIKPRLAPEIKMFPELIRDAGYYTTNASKEDYNFDYSGRTVWDESSRNAHWKNRPTDDTPFFAIFNYTDTHEGSVRSAASAYAKKTTRLTDAQRRDPAELTIPPYHADTPTIRRQWANVHELVTGMDYWVADHLQALEEAGVAEDTIVIFWSDHGTGLPRHKRWVYDSGVHIPLIVYVPEKWQGEYGVKPGMVVDDLVSSVDFAPTTLNMLGLDIPENMQGQAFLGPNLPEPRKYVFGGRDRMDERYDMIRFVRDSQYKLVINYMPQKPYSQYTNTAEKSPVQVELNRLAKEGNLPDGARWVTQKTKPLMEFYDLENDPHELNNLFTDSDNVIIEDSKYTDIRQHHFEAYLEWSMRIGDLGLIPEAELNRLGNEFEYRSRIISSLEKKERAFRKKLHGMISFVFGPPLSSYSSDPELKRQYGILEAHWVDALDSELPSLRYWGVQGLSRFENAHPALVRTLNDESMVVRLAAAQALVTDAKYSEISIDIMTAGMNSDDEWVRLQAVTALDEIGDLARPATSALKKALDDKHNKYVVRIANHTLNVLEGTNNQVR